MIRRSLQGAAVALLAVPVLAGCEAGLNAPTLQYHPAANGAYTVADAIRVNNAFVVAAPSGSSLPAGSQAGLFLSLWNTGTSSDALTSVSASAAASSVTLPGGTVTLQPNSGVNLTGPTPEIILNGLTQPLSGGQSVSVTLDFQNAGPVTLNVPVEPQSYAYATISQPPSPTPTPTATPTTAAAQPTSRAKPKAKTTAKAKATATATPTK